MKAAFGSAMVMRLILTITLTGMSCCQTVQPRPELEVEIVDRVQVMTLTGDRAYFFEVRWVSAEGIRSSTRIGVPYRDWVRFRDTSIICLHKTATGYTLDPCK